MKLKRDDPFLEQKHCSTSNQRTQMNVYIYFLEDIDRNLNVFSEIRCESSENKSLDLICLRFKAIECESYFRDFRQHK